MVIPELTFKTSALNSTTIYSESRFASGTRFVILPKLKVMSVPEVNGPPLIAVPGTVNVGATLPLEPFTTRPAPESVEEVMQAAPLLQTKATFPVLSFRNCKPVGIPSDQKSVV